MRPQPAIVMIIVFGSVAFFFLVLPLGIVLFRSLAVWRANRVVGVLLGGVVVLTCLLFALYLVGLGIIAFTGQ